MQWDEEFLLSRFCKQEY